MTPETRDRRLAYIVDHRDTIYVHERVAGRLETISLAELELRAPGLLAANINRLIEQDSPPHRKLREGEARPTEEIDW